MLLQHLDLNNTTFISHDHHAMIMSSLSYIMAV